MGDSILDRYELTVERFEAAIAVGRTRSQMLSMFHKTVEEMDKWCRETYGHDFKTVEEWVRQCTIDEYLHLVRDLGIGGNASALAIIDKAIQKDESASTVAIRFVASGVKPTGDDDKEDDG